MLQQIRTNFTTLGQLIEFLCTGRSSPTGVYFSVRANRIGQIGGIAENGNVLMILGYYVLYVNSNSKRRLLVIFFPYHLPLALFFHCRKFPRVLPPSVRTTTCSIVALLLEQSLADRLHMHHFGTNSSPEKCYKEAHSSGSNHRSPSTTSTGTPYCNSRFET